MTYLFFSILWGLLILCVMCFGMLPYFGGKYGRKVSDLSRHVLRRCIEWVLSSLLPRIPGLKHYIGSVSQQKLLFVPDADNKPEEDHEISEPVLFRFLLNEETLKQLDAAEAETTQILGVLKDIDKKSEITEFETHQSTMGLRKDLKGAFHVFIVFKTTSETDGDYWWSLEKGMDYITLQRSRNKENVKDKCYGETRHKVKSIKEKMEGKGTIKDLFAVLWAQQMIVEKYHLMNSNCQSFVTFVSKQMTQEKYEFQGFFNCPTPPENDRKTEMLDLINILTVSIESWHPLFTLIYLENTDMFDTITKGGEYDMGITQYGVTLLNFAIVFSKTEMVKHLLNPPYSADPTEVDYMGRNALQMAAVFTEQPEIFDSLLAHSKVKIDDVDELGRTALHSAACVSNVAAVKHLLANGANPNFFDKDGIFPLHVAAFHNRGTEILDLILQAKKAKTGNEGIDDVDDKQHGMTALHCAAFKSNEITAEHLIKKGANVNHPNNDGTTPLHMSALFAENMKIIDVLLKNIKDEEIDQYKKDATLLRNAYCNQHDLGDEITKLLVAKGMVSNEQVENHQIFLKALNAVKQQVAQKSRSKSSNEHGLGGAMPNLMEEAGSVPNIEATFEDFKEMNNFKADAGGIAHFLGDNALKMEDKLGQVFRLALANAIMNSDVKSIRRLSKQFGADFSKVTWGGMNVLHAASYFAKTTEILDVILATGNFDINGVDNNGNTPLQYAIIAKNVITVGYLLEKEADPTENHLDGITPFHIASAYVRDSDILDLFLANNKKFDIDHRNQSGRTALHMAIATSNVTAARFLLSKGANPNAADDNGFTPLHLAADFAKKLDIVKLLLNHEDTNVNLLDNKGNTALDYAMSNEHGLGEEIANLLREKGAAKTQVEKFHFLDEGGGRQIGNFPTEEEIQNEGEFEILMKAVLKEAIVNSDAEMVRTLIEMGADSSTLTWEEQKCNALHLASQYAKTTDVIDAILETGKFDINGVDNDGNTPLHHAIMRSDSRKNVPRLIQLRADPNIADKNGITPLHLAAKNKETTDLIDDILKTGQCNINPVDSDGRTPLHYAIKRPDPVTINARHLIKKGANPNVADKNGVTPLHLAARNAESMDLIELLLNTEAVDVNCVDIKGRTPLVCARNNKHGLGQRIIFRLKESSANE